MEQKHPLRTIAFATAATLGALVGSAAHPEHASAQTDPSSEQTTTTIAPPEGGLYICPDGTAYEIQPDSPMPTCDTTTTTEPTPEPAPKITTSTTEPAPAPIETPTTQMQDTKINVAPVIKEPVATLPSEVTSNAKSDSDRGFPLKEAGLGGFVAAGGLGVALTLNKRRNKV